MMVAPVTYEASSDPRKTAAPTISSGSPSRPSGSSRRLASRTSGRAKNSRLPGVRVGPAPKAFHPDAMRGEVDGHALRELAEGALGGRVVGQPGACHLAQLGGGAAPESRTRQAVLSAPGPLRSAQTTSAPAAETPSASARPTPPAAPATTARRPARRPLTVTGLRVRAGSGPGRAWPAPPRTRRRGYPGDTFGPHAREASVL